MKVYGIWCNKQKAWYTNGKSFVVTGVPKTWSVKGNAQSRIKDLTYWANRPWYKNQPFPYDLRLVELDLLPVDNKHLV